MSQAKNRLEPFRRLITGTIQHTNYLTWEVVELEHSITIEITPHGEDYGRINGTKGANISALKILGDAAGRRIGKAIFFSLEDSVIGGKPENRPPFKPSDEWDQDPLKKMIQDLIDLTMPGEFFFLADGKRTTTAEIDCSRSNVPVAESLKTWIRAWGKANGRDITTNIIPRDEELQPGSADGRYTRATTE